MGGRTTPPRPGAGCSFGTTKPTLTWVSPLAPSRASWIFTEATVYSSLSVAPGAGVADTVLLSMAVTLPTRTASAVATRSGTGDGRATSARALAGAATANTDRAA